MAKRWFHLRLFDRLRPAARRLAQRRATVALIVGLSAPALLGAAGLSVDIGYWFQQQESLQSAADAAALAAATADEKYGDTTANQVEPFALAAANNASNNQFGLTSTSLTITPGSPVNETDGQTVTTFTANAQIPRGSFFSATGGLGPPAGNIAVSAQAAIVATPQPYCVIATNTAAAASIYANGSSQIASTSCGYISDSAACAGGDNDSIAADPSAQIVAPAISTVGCTYANTSGGAYVGVNSGSAANRANNGYQVTNNAAAATDPLASMGSPPAWPAMPAPGTSGYTQISTSTDLGYVPSGTRHGVTCGNYNADCTIVSGNYTGLSSVNADQLTFNYPIAGTTNINGGFGGNVNTSLSLNASNYDISGSTNASGTVTNWAMQVNTKTFTVAAGTDEFNGGMQLANFNPLATFGTGTYMFSACSGCSAALDDVTANITFAGGTYWFNGGLKIEGNATVTFGPGIYYIENGNLNFMSGSHVTANGATFVLENGAGYQMNGGTVALNLTAPSGISCVQPSSYPNPLYTDGTNGEGICGVLIYQARNDSTADAVNAGANSTVTGIIYAPSGSLSVTGGATIASADPSQTFALIVNTISATGGTKILPSLAANSNLGSATTTTTMLVQ
jgi:Flp pilus assembly protein TadG